MEITKKPIIEPKRVEPDLEEPSEQEPKKTRPEQIDGFKEVLELEMEGFTLKIGSFSTPVERLCELSLWMLQNAKQENRKRKHLTYMG